MKHPRIDARCLRDDGVCEGTRLIIEEHNPIAALPPKLLAEVLSGRGRRAPGGIGHMAHNAVPPDQFGIDEAIAYKEK